MKKTILKIAAALFTVSLLSNSSFFRQPHQISDKPYTPASGIAVCSEESPPLPTDIQNPSHS